MSFISVRIYRATNVRRCRELLSRVLEQSISLWQEITEGILVREHSKLKTRTLTPAISRQLFTTEVWIQSHGKPCRIFGGQSGPFPENLDLLLLVINNLGREAV
jgi:hypothetical protein